MCKTIKLPPCQEGIEFLNRRLDEIKAELVYVRDPKIENSLRKERLQLKAQLADLKETLEVRNEVENCDLAISRDPKMARTVDRWCSIERRRGFTFGVALGAGVATLGTIAGTILRLCKK